MSIPFLPQGRQAWSVALDALLAYACYHLAYRVRFSGEALALFLPGAHATAGWVVGGQILGALLAGVYVERPIGAKVKRLLIGIGLGTIAAAAVVWFTQGLEGVSRSAFGVSAVLLLLTTMAWRAVRVLVATRPQVQQTGGLSDRLGERTTVADTIWALVRYRELLRNLVFKDLKLKYRGSVLGFLWSLVHPLAMMLVYTLAFKVVMKNPQPNFLLFLLIGILAWTFFAGSLTMATGSIIDAGGLMKGVRFPRAILPLATVLFNLSQYALTLTVLLPLLLLIHGLAPKWPMLLFPLLVALQVIFTAGLALMVAAATAFFRDVRHLLDIALSLLFWTTPIVYPLSMVPERAQALFLLSPMSPFVSVFHQVMYDRQWPDPSLLLLVITYAVTSAAMGLALFLAVEDRLSEQL